MKRWMQLGVLVVVVLLITSTSFVGAAAGDGGGEQARPFKIGVDFVNTIVGEMGTLGCDDASFPTALEGGGHATHLGKVEVTGFNCSNFVTGAITNGAVTYTAANGDTLDVTYSGQADVNEADATFIGGGVAAIVGGSERFESAYGDWTWTITGSILPDFSTVTSLEGDGWIVYDASDRSR